MDSNLFAAIDLGSNSFHMLVVQNIDGTPRTIAKVKQKVRLASGLNEHNHLDDDSMARGWQCLALFAPFLKNIPTQNIRIVSTATLRLANNAQQFCHQAKQILGHPIDVISGEQEAALIYHGMAVTSESADKRLIVDIGGASTELILGQGFTPLVLNSVNLGCVTWLARYFKDDMLNDANVKQAISAAKQALFPVYSQYSGYQWQLSLGASGSIQAVQEVLIAQGLNEEITPEKLALLLDQVIECKEQSKLSIVGLKQERKLVFVSGLVILIAIFEVFKLQRMIGSGGALREGLIDQLINPKQALSNVRGHFCQQLQARHQLDTAHAARVAEAAIEFAKQLKLDATTQDLALLKYAALLHEIGTSVEFLSANLHGQYVLSQQKLIGFSKEQQRFIVSLVANYKNKVQQKYLLEQAWCQPKLGLQLMCCLRLAVIVMGRGSAQLIDKVKLVNRCEVIEIGLTTQNTIDDGWLIAQLNLEDKHNPLVCFAP